MCDRHTTRTAPNKRGEEAEKLQRNAIRLNNMHVLNLEKTLDGGRGTVRVQFCA
jgi:hypothetical protein